MKNPYIEFRDHLIENLDIPKTIFEFKFPNDAKQYQGDFHIAIEPDPWSGKHKVIEKIEHRLKLGELWEGLTMTIRPNMQDYFREVLDSFFVNNAQFKHEMIDTIETFSPKDFGIILLTIKGRSAEFTWPLGVFDELETK